MSFPALVDWRSHRARRLDRLLAAHRTFIHRWRIALDGLATGMDHVVEDHLYRTSGIRPW